MGSRWSLPATAGPEIPPSTTSWRALRRRRSWPAAARVGVDTLAKLLFTSGSTGAPKAVINTHGMLCANQAMIADHFPFLDASSPVLVDWLPWSHTFGGNNNFNTVLYHGGSLYIDGGRPVPGQFEPTVQALREVAPTLHFTVPKGWRRWRSTSARTQR